ncbi:MAG: SDR family oxidoreductase [Solirubrobacterales bacterium]|nr:SDR family oxidoreductase [Solirubrobacterales bacterium]
MTMTALELARSRPLDLFDLSGRSALVTGATGAFGTAASRALAGAGAVLTLAGAGVEKLEALREELATNAGAVELVGRRPESDADADAMVAAAVGAHGRLDIVVCASGFNKPGAATDMPVEQWEAIMDANVLGAWLVCRAAGRRLIEQAEGGKVILMSSVRGRHGLATGYSAYCPSKAAVDGLTKALACEWGPHGINVNAIGPTVFRSDLTSWMYEEEGPGRATREGMLARISLGRLGEPEDFVGPLLFLSSAASDFVTGQILYVDGGYTAS